MPVFKIDPFENVRKNAHIWHGEKCICWYNEKLDGSFTLLVLYNFGDAKRRLLLEVDDKNRKTEFKNDELNAELYDHLLKEIEFVEKISQSPTDSSTNQTT